MEGGIYALHGYFGAKKTLGSVKMILQSLSKGKIVFTNIKFNTNYIDKRYINNLYYFDDINCLHDILAFSGYFALKVSEYNEKAIVNNEQLYPRENRPMVEIYFDEMGIFANSSDYQKFHQETGKDLTQYLLQIRKLFVNIFFIIQKPKRLVKELREYVSFWIKPVPMFPELENVFGFGFLKNCKKYYGEIRDEEGELEFDTKLKLNTTTGIYENYKVPLIFDFMYILRVPYYYRFYDDLWLNLKVSFTMKTKFLVDSNFLKNVYLGKINNSYLKINKKIYDEFALTNYQDTELVDFITQSNKKPRFLDNPLWYFIHFIYWLKSQRIYRFLTSGLFLFILWIFFLIFLYFKVFT